MKVRRGSRSDVAGRAAPSENLPAHVEDEATMSARVLSQVLERSTRAQAPAVRAYVARLRRSNPDATPAEIVTKLEKRYLAAVMASGAAVGSAAAFPGIGTLAALSAVAGETLVFLEATTVFVLAVADVHGIPLEQRERRRALVLAVLVGEKSRGAIADLIGPSRTSGAWLAEGADMLPLPALAQLNTRLMRYFVKRFTLKRSAMAFGKMLPVGIGAAVGGGGNRMMGKKIVNNARAAFGSAPSRWPVSLHLLPAIEPGG
ncbi:membrane protein [Mycolicibacterium aromaticivorans JS19b1 = JCM 16368]|uniref:Membrane protein n=1 Tax=Mycolicibacterium aromaticivorans JS19b1 = JCM 16368 TaxID=1440774 RepID=A0A064CL51_9MYCO|nr:membrane protein [Mycolicibacterium aromaticivorans JS19b1 = JCM 16368]